MPLGEKYIKIKRINGKDVEVYMIQVFYKYS